MARHSCDSRAEELSVDSPMDLVDVLRVNPLAFKLALGGTTRTCVLIIPLCPDIRPSSAKLKRRGHEPL
jgi:hypothetical protein